MAYQPQDVRSARAPLPTMYDLPSENPEEPGLLDEFHDYQPQLLRETFRSTAHLSEQVLIGTDLNLYYDARHPLWYKRPDWFVALGVDRAVTQDELRRSYLIWQEGVSPYLVVELLSPGTEAEDLGQTLWDTAQVGGLLKNLADALLRCLRSLYQRPSRVSARRHEVYPA